jgi:acyl dehydratase
LAVQKFPVEAGHIMMFARAIGDANPIYYDEDYAKTTEPGSIIAPPTFIQASDQFDPDYPLRPQTGQPWFGSGKEPTGMKPDAVGAIGSLANVLHAEQHYEYHRPIRPGDVLKATVRPGRTWEKEGRRSGKLVFFEMIVEFRDQAETLVVTSRIVGVRTERVVAQEEESG